MGNTLKMGRFEVQISGETTDGPNGPCMVPHTMAVRFADFLSMQLFSCDWLTSFGFSCSQTNTYGGVCSAYRDAEPRFWLSLADWRQFSSSIGDGSHFRLLVHMRLDKRGLPLPFTI